MMAHLVYILRYKRPAGHPSPGQGARRSLLPCRRGSMLIIPIASRRARYGACLRIAGVPQFNRRSQDDVIRLLGGPAVPAHPATRNLHAWRGAPNNSRYTLGPQAGGQRAARLLQWLGDAGNWMTDNLPNAP